MPQERKGKSRNMKLSVAKSIVRAGEARGFHKQVEVVESYQPPGKRSVRTVGVVFSISLGEMLSLIADASVKTLGDGQVQHQEFVEDLRNVHIDDMGLSCVLY